MTDTPVVMAFMAPMPVTAVTARYYVFLSFLSSD
jgi:hypothetical protein